MSINKLIDHTLLKAFATKDEIIKLCEEAKLYDFASVCVNPCNVKLAKELLENTDVLVCTVIGFPNGYNTSNAKVYETLEAIAKLSGGDVRTALNGIEVAVLTTIPNQDGVIEITDEEFNALKGKKTYYEYSIRKEMLEAMKNDLEVTFREYTDRGEVYLMAATSADEETTKGWVDEIKEHFPGMEVKCMPLTLGVSCHTGEGALGIGCSCKPKRFI